MKKARTPKRQVLAAYWCEKCKRVVCEGVPGATVWCACGRRAEEIKQGQFQFTKK